MNNCVFVGRLTKDPELSSSAKSGKSYSRFSLAVQRNKDETDFLDFTAFGATAEFVEKYFSKGDPMSVSAEAQQGQWEDTDGNKRSKVNFVVRNVSFVPSKTKPSGSTNNGEVVDAGVSNNGDNDIPF